MLTKYTHLATLDLYYQMDLHLNDVRRSQFVTTTKKRVSAKCQRNTLWYCQYRTLCFGSNIGITTDTLVV